MAETQLLPYERIEGELLVKAIRLCDGERLLVRRPFGWHIDGHHIPNAAEHFEREGVCEEHGWVVVCDYGPHIAVVRVRTERDVLLRTLRGLHDDVAEYARINNLGGFGNHWLTAARVVLEKAEAK
jgi:hypothetical protein